MNIIALVSEHKEIINIGINLLAAAGTIGAAAIALHLGYKDSKPKLTTRALISLMPEGAEYLQFWCINEGKQPVIVKSFEFDPKTRKKTAPKIGFYNSASNLSAQLPKLLTYSDDANVYFSIDCLKSPELKKFLGSYKWLAKLKLKFFWRAVAYTNIGRFEGELYSCVIKKILHYHYEE